MRPVRDAAAVPGDGVGRGRALPANVGAIQRELDAGDADGVRRRRVEHDCSSDDTAVNRRRHGHGGRGRVVVHRHTHARCDPRIARRVSRHNRDDVDAVGNRAAVPGHLIRRRRVFRAEVDPVERELHAGHGDVVGRGCGQRDRSSDGRSVGRTGDGRVRRGRVVVHGDARARRRLRVARGVTRDRGNHVSAVRNGGAVPLHRIRRGRILGADVDAIERKSHAHDADVIGRRRTQRDRSNDRRTGRRARDRDARRGRIVRDGDVDTRLGLIAGPVSCHGAEHMGAARCRRAVPVQGERRRRGFAQTHAVERELNTDHRDVIGGVHREWVHTSHRATGCGARQRHIRSCRVWRRASGRMGPERFIEIDTAVAELQVWQFQGAIVEVPAREAMIDRRLELRQQAHSTGHQRGTEGRAGDRGVTSTGIERDE